MIRTVYLAGPDVFLPDAASVGRRKVDLCRRHGFEGLFPLDNDVPAQCSPVERGIAIYRANVELMERADAVVANLTPFRGSSADAGTVFELGYFAAQAKPIHAYSSDVRAFAERTRQQLGLPTGAEFDHEGVAIEDFDMADNLMLAGAVAAAGGVWVARVAAPGRQIAAFEAFEECLAGIARSASADPHKLAAG